ncbi:MAG: hypothetical protein JETT_2871 [Candidatus Jettenia ecosi]|uniref:DUF3854 domain-containing protein n=1 Tax=Candidatus Jettenia ecosi TaxID=2494326 RepID=A0A533Q9G3_9BACT|nr:MAG: hypothetical protein JETT_2871 [Candidatus Jettenia ecosi]
MMKKIETYFHPEHLLDLRKSDLTDEAIHEAVIKSLRLQDIDREIGFQTYATSAYKIPYPETDYTRNKMFYAETDKINPKTSEERPKYLARKNSGNRLYIPHKVRQMIRDLSIPLYITEGEKKALKATQEGFSCVAIAGLWNWPDGSKELIEDFNLIPLDGRTVYIIPDGNWLEPNTKGERKNLKQAIYELSYRLIDMGAKVCWVELPKNNMAVLIPKPMLIPLKTIENDRYRK